MTKTIKELAEAYGCHRTTLTPRIKEILQWPNHRRLTVLWPSQLEKIYAELGNPYKQKDTPNIVPLDSGETHAK